MTPKPSNSLKPACLSSSLHLQALGIPELMPFRLTRQLLGALQPHDGRELLVAPMTDAMRAMGGSRYACRDIQHFNHMKEHG